MSTWQVVKNDISATVGFAENAATASGLLMEAAASAHTTFHRIAPHLSNNPEIAACADKMQHIFALASEAHQIAFECFHAVDDVNNLFT
jgi:hypothetical protein